MFGNIGTVELLVIGAVLLLLFGGSKLPELARGISKASEEFNKGLKGDTENTTKTTKKKRS